MQHKKSSHTVYGLRYHIVWVCKYRRRILKPGVTIYFVSSVDADEATIRRYVEYQGRQDEGEQLPLL